MFEKERDLLLVEWKFDFAKFESAIEQRQKFESTLDNVQAKVSEALEKARECRTRINSAECTIALRNEEKVKALYVSLAEWMSLYELLGGMSKASPKAFEEKSVAAGMRELASYVDQFKKYLKTQEEFEEVATLVRKLQALAALSETSVARYCEVIREHASDLKSAYLPTTYAALIEKALEMEATIERLNEFYGRVSDYLGRHMDLLHIMENPSELKSIASVYKKYDEYVNYTKGEISTLTSFKTEFKEMKGDRSLTLFGKYEENYEREIDHLLERFNKALNGLYAARKSLEGHISLRGTISKILGIIMYAMMIGAAGCTVLNTILVFGKSIQWFWAVLFGLIVGVLFAVIRVAALYGLGALWWPSAFATMFFGPRSLEVNKAVLIFNIVFLVVSFVYAELTIYREDRDVRGGSSSGIRAMAMSVPFIGTLALVVAVVWSGIAGLVRLWSIWGIFEVFCGFFLGLFRVIMLIIGAGFWWPGLFACTGDNGMILNIAFYALIVIFGVYAARQKD